MNGTSKMAPVSAGVPMHSGHAIALSRDGLPVITAISSTYVMSVVKCRDVLCTRYYHNQINTLQEVEYVTPDDSFKHLNASSLADYRRKRAAAQLMASTATTSTASTSTSTPTPSSPLSSSVSSPTSSSSSSRPLGAPDAFPISRVIVGRDANPLIVYTGTNRMVVAHCADAECEALFSLKGVSTSATVASIGLALATDGLPLIAYANTEGSFATPVVVKCKTPGCSSLVENEIPGVYLPQHSRISINIGADGLPVLSMTGAWRGRAIVSPVELVSKHVSEGSAGTAYEALREHNVISDKGVVDMTMNMSDPAFFADILYTKEEDLSVREMQMRETLNILRLHQGANNTRTISRHALVAHCGDLACSPGSVRIARPYSAEEGIVDTDVTITPSGQPLVAILRDETKNPNGNKTIEIVSCSAPDCYKTLGDDPIDGGVVHKDLVKNFSSMSYRISISSTSSSSSHPLIMFDKGGYTSLARCKNADCSSLHINGYFDTEGSCTLAPCSAVAVSTVDSLPFVVYGTSNVQAMHCSNPFCVPYMTI